MRKLTIKKKISDKWLEQCHHVIKEHLILFDNHAFYSNKIQGTIDYVPFIRNNGQSITPKYAQLIKAVLKQFDVIGVWKESLYPGTIDTVIILELYGYTEELKLCHNMLDYLINGFDKYFDEHVSRLRKARQVRRFKGTPLFNEIDARKRTNMNIMRKVRVLEELLDNFQVFYNIPYTYPKGRTTKLKDILDIILSYEKLNYRVYRGQKGPTLKTLYARKGHIQLNRLV